MKPEIKIWQRILNDKSRSMQINAYNLKYTPPQVRSAARLESGYLHNLSFRLKIKQIDPMVDSKFSHPDLYISAVTQSLLLHITGNFRSNFRRFTSMNYWWSLLHLCTSVNYSCPFESASKVRDRWCSSNVMRQTVPYCRCGKTKGARSNFRMG